MAAAAAVDSSGIVTGLALVILAVSVAVALVLQRTGRLPTGATTSRPETPDRTEVTPLSARTDPLAPARVAALWWCLAAVGLGALALVLRPWLAGAVLRRRPRP